METRESKMPPSPAMENVPRIFFKETREAKMDELSNNALHDGVAKKVDGAILPDSPQAFRKLLRPTT
jgi:hypothetical protein